jgi:murein DD-endopeptidase MepM/ murein hydrolase activator NlpD
LHGGHGRRALAGGPGPLRAGFLAAGLALLLGLPAAPAASAPPPLPGPWFRPVPVDGKVFPVLRPARGRWLSFRDNFGEPILEREDGKWRTVGRHEGVDVYADEGTPVVSMTAGVVERIGWTEFSGWRIGIQGTDGFFYFYGHLHSYVAGLKPGARVGAGERLGYLGSSGYGPRGTSGNFPAHLHFGVQSAGRWRDPGKIVKSLYSAYVERTRSDSRRLAGLENRGRLLRSRMYGPGAPGEVGHELLAEIERAEARLSRRLTVS